VTVRAAASLFLVAATVLGGCVTAAPPPRYPVGPEARRAIELLEARWRAFSGLRTLANVSVQRGRERHQGQAVILAKSPASVRFEALSPLGSPLLVATIQDGHVIAYDATRNEAQTGPATSEIAGRVLGLPLDPEDLVAVLAGHALPPRDVRVAEVLPADDVGPSLQLVGEVNRRRIWLDLSTGIVRQLDITGGRAEARIRYDRDDAGQMRGFDLSAGMSYVTASVRYSNPVFDASLPADLFAFSVPNGAKVTPIR
jgi:outer membrane lipoprotein-sorting protein